jgi:transketolase C-terminal domain/subunit
MLAVMKWVMAGNRGLLYVRVMRTPSAVLYDSTYQFEFGTASFVHGSSAAAAFIVSSGRGVHEAIAAARECAASGVQVAVVDMPSIDEDMLLQLCDSGKLVCLAEQNNGYILQNLLKIQHRRRKLGSDPRTTPNVMDINTLDSDGRPQFIHSGTYEELIEAFGLTASHIANAVVGALNERGSR